MEVKSAPRKQNSLSPKPGMTSVVNSLIQTKDEVHTKLLEETKKSADLSNMFTTLDEQLRAAIDKTLRNMKTELEKQRKRLLPGIRRLEDASKSLKKSESILEGNDRTQRNADVKKATRRIKDAKRVVEEFPPSNGDLGIHSYIADQITSLCQRIRQIPVLLNDSELKHKYNIPVDKSFGSSSDSFKSQEASPLLNTRRTGKDSSSNKSKIRYNTRTKTLNGVEMFSSDSDTIDDNFDIGQYIPIKVERTPYTGFNEIETGESIYAEIGDDSRHSTEYLTPLEARQADNDRDTHERSRWRQGISDTSTPDRNKLSSVHDFDQNNTAMAESGKIDESKKDKIYISTRKPLPLPRKAKPIENYTAKAIENKATDQPGEISINQYTERQNITNETQTADIKTYAFAKAKCIPKRLLPSVPKNVSTKPSTNPYSTVSNTERSSEQLADRRHRLLGMNDIDSPGQVDNEADAELRDIEEIQFKESVQTCRQHIIERLKERYTLHPSNHRTPSPEITFGRSDLSTAWGRDNTGPPIQTSMSDNDTRRNSNFDIQVKGQTKYLSKSTGSTVNKKENNPIASGNAREGGKQFTELTDRIKSPNTHWSKLVMIENYSPTLDNAGGNGNITKEPENASVSRNQTNSDSIVTKGIMKFENTGPTNCGSRRYSLPKGHWKHSPNRQRSMSAEGVPLQTARYRYRSTSNVYALAPRSRKPIQALDNSLDVLGIRQFGSIESNLDKICNESKRSIRQEWYQRRSQSQQNPSRTPEVVKGQHSYIYHSSFCIPDHKAERCHISSIVMLPDGKAVVLDQRRRRMYTFDRHYVFLRDCPILEFPGNMVAVKDDMIAVSYPYKSKSGVYLVGSNGAITYQRDVVSPCTKWVNDIGFAKGHLYLLCKGGDVHIITTDNTEVQTISAGMNGRILVHPSGRRFYIIGEGRISKFNSDGAMLSSIEHIGAYSLILLNDNLYAVDRQKHRIVSVRFGLTEENDLIGKVEYPAAVGVSATGEQLLISQFEESINIQTTRTIHVYKLNT